jgi:hypothetical protein
MIYRLSIYYYRYSLASPRRGACPESLGELACFAGRQVPKNAPHDPLCCGRQPPVQRTLTMPPQPRQYTQQSVQWTAGIRCRFRAFSGIEFFCRPSWFSPAATNAHRWAGCGLDSVADECTDFRGCSGGISKLIDSIWWRVLLFFFREC